MQTSFYSKKAGGLDLDDGDETIGAIDEQNVEIPTPYTEEELNDIADEIINEIGEQYIPYGDYYNKCLEIFIKGDYNTLFYDDVWNVLNGKIPVLKENQNLDKSSISSPNVSNVWTGTMDEYDALKAYDNSTIYFITEGQI